VTASSPAFEITFDLPSRQLRAILWLRTARGA
jgi:hypothetical protein